MKKIYLLLPALGLALNLGAQTSQPLQATDFNKWVAYMTTAISAPGSASFLVTPGFISGTRGEGPVPVLVNNGYVTVDTGANSETLQVTSVTCTAQGPDSHCTGTASFGYAHPGSRTLVTSATSGAQEAYSYASKLGGGDVVLGPDFGSSNTPLSYVQGGASVMFEDLRSGAPAWWTWTGSAYKAQIAPSYTDCGTSAACASPTLASGLLAVLGHTAFAGSTTLTLTGLPFSSATTFACTFSDPTHAYTWTTANASGASTVVTAGTSNSDTWTWNCVGH